MLADAVESASRSLSDPTPKRIENLIHDITMNRLLDGQFDECALHAVGNPRHRGIARQVAHRHLSRPH